MQELSTPAAVWPQEWQITRERRLHEGVEDVHQRAALGEVGGEALCGTPPLAALLRLVANRNEHRIGRVQSSTRGGLTYQENLFKYLT